MSRLQRQTAYGILLSVIAIAILVIGYLVRPRRLVNQKNSSIASDITAIQAEVERLRHLAEQNQRRATSNRFAAVAEEAALHLVYAPSMQRSGIIWSKDGFVLLPSKNFPSQPTVPLEMGGRQITAQASAWGAGTAFMMVRANTTPGPPVTLGTPDNLAPGAWLVAVGVDQNGKALLSPGNFGGTSVIECGGSSLQRVMTNLPLGRAWIGSGLFDLDGNLIGVVGQCRDEIAAISTSAVANALKDAEEPTKVPWLRAGMRVSDISAKWQPVSGARTGLIVTDVWQGWPADRAGINPGDIILAVNSERLKSLTDFSKALETAGIAKLTLQRRRRIVTVTLGTGPASIPGAPPFTIRDENGVELSNVQPGSRAGALGLVSGDRIIFLDGVPASRAAVVRLFTASDLTRPVAVVAERGSRRFLEVMAP